MADETGLETPELKAKRKPQEDLRAIQADVASFVASLGLASSGALGSGFDDSDFRKTGPIRKKERTEEGQKEKKEVKFGDGKKDLKHRKGREDRKDVGTSPGKKLRGDGDRKGGLKENGGGKSRVKDSRVAGGPKVEIGDGFGGLKYKPFDPTNSKKRKGSWNNQVDGEDKFDAERAFVERPSLNEPESVRKLRSEGQELLEKAVHDHQRSREKSSDAHWLDTARRAGTSADKVAAMTVILQENPKCNLRTLDSLIGMVTSKGGKRHAATGIDALKELFMFSLLPDRKLKYFAQQPLSTLPVNKERAPMLLDWYWEDCLKHRYERFVLALEEATHDSLPFLKDKALKSLYELLKSKPEQERKLLSVLVNKLGDPDRKTASNASYLLSSLLTAHPNMKTVVVTEVDSFVFRPHVGLRARYYAAIFLNQIVLSNKGNGPKLAKQLIDLYFALFKAVTTDVVEDKDEGKSKKHDRGKKKGQQKGKPIADSATFTTEIDSRLLSALLTGVNRAFPYVAVDDVDTVTQENSVLFRLVHSSNFNVAVQALMLLHQLMMKNEAVSDRFYRALYSVLLSESLVKSAKAEMFLGLIFKALKSDVDPRRMSAFAKRLTQVALQQPPQFACASLLLLSETLKLKPSLWNAVLHPEDHDEDIEHFEDEKDDTDCKLENEHESKVIDVNETDKPSDSTAGDKSWPMKGYYDPKLRDPLYCNAQRACWWELTVLARHVHPSVAAMARTLLSGANVLYNGDPLRDLALGVFLDRFAEKKPKANQSGAWHGSAMAAPSKLAGGQRMRPVGDEFLSMAVDDVAPEDIMFHKFYVTKSSKTKTKKKSKGKSEEDITGLDEVADFDGDDSDDEEVDALLEQEAGLQMDGDDLSEEEDLESDGEDLILHEQDDESGSDMETVNSDDEEAEALLEAGMEMSSSDGEGMDSEDEVGGSDSEDIEELLSKKGRRQKEISAKKRGKKGGSVIQKAKGSDGESSPKRGNKRKQTMTKKPVRRGVSVFAEADGSDDPDSEEHLPKKKKKLKHINNIRASKKSVFQEAGPDHE